jgi:hypothetical protein
MFVWNTLPPCVATLVAIVLVVTVSAPMAATPPFGGHVLGTNLNCSELSCLRHGGPRRPQQPQRQRALAPIAGGPAPPDSEQFRSVPRTCWAGTGYSGKVAACAFPRVVGAAGWGGTRDGFATAVLESASCGWPLRVASNAIAHPIASPAPEIGFARQAEILGLPFLLRCRHKNLVSFIE